MFTSEICLSISDFHEASMNKSFNIDFSELEKIREAFGATQSQMLAAYDRALKRVAAKLNRRSVALIISETAMKGSENTEKRVQSFLTPAHRGGKKAGTLKIWFGLNAAPVSELKGKMQNPPGMKPKSRKRDERGRFLAGNGARGATFTPKGKGLHPTSFRKSFVGTARGKKSIWIRSSSGYVNEAKLPIYHPMLRGIEGDLYDDANELIMKEFEQDLRGRMKMNIK